MKSFKQLMESLMEAWPGTPGYKKSWETGEGSSSGNRHNIEKKGGITRATRKYDNESGESEEPKQSASGEAPVKRGRGRPPGKYGSYKKKVKESLEIMESMETEEEIAAFMDSLDEESFEALAQFIESKGEMEDDEEDDKKEDDDKEESKKLEELSKTTLKSYTDKAVDSAATHAYVAGGGTGQSETNKKKDFRTAVKRIKGVEKATTRLAKEEVEQTTEAYTGKNPHHIKSVGSSGQGMVTVVTNAGAKHTISAKNTGGKMPKPGEPISKYVKEDVEQTDENIKHPNQKVLDKNKNGKLDKEDFKILRGEKKANEETEKPQESLVDSIAALITKQAKGEA